MEGTLAENDGSPQQENADPLFALPPPASCRNASWQRSSQGTRKGRAVCAERCKHGSREGGTGDPVRDDRPLLYSLHALSDMTWITNRSVCGRNAGKVGLIQGGENTLSRFVREAGQLLIPLIDQVNVRGVHTLSV